MVKLVEPSWVAEALGSPEVLVLDPRTRTRYLQGHLKGSISLPVSRLVGDNGRLLPADRLADLFAAAGLEDTVVPVVYDSYDGQRGAFMAWALEYLGSRDVHLMDTFFEGWVSQGNEIFYRPVEPSPRSFTARVVPEIRATLEQVREKGAARLLDVRSAEEFTGSSDVDARPGHIPGATNLIWRRLLGTGDRFLDSAENIRQLLADSGISPNDPVIAYCRVGMRAGVAYLALQQLGYDVRLYDGSYSEWQDAGLPVEGNRSSAPGRGSLAG